MDDDVGCRDDAVTVRADSQVAASECARRETLGVGDARATAGCPDYVPSMPSGMDGHGSIRLEVATAPSVRRLWRDNKMRMPRRLTAL